ncbi:MAG: T9SS type A sorting domain-containing protein, partial [Lacibacter sp.]
SFKNAGYVTATGKNIYGLDFPEKQVQTMYYRVKNVDFDGKSKYSTIIRVYTKEQTNGKIQLYPLPAMDMVTVQHNRSNENAIITVFSQEGKLLQQVRPATNTLQTQLSIGSLSKGVYIVRFNDGQGNIQSIKLLKN